MESDKVTVQYILHYYGHHRIYFVFILKDFKKAQILTDCISGTTTCRDKSFISETRNVLFFEIRCPAGRINVYVLT